MVSVLITLELMEKYLTVLYLKTHILDKTKINQLIIKIIGCKEKFFNFLFPSFVD